MSIHPRQNGDVSNGNGDSHGYAPLGGHDRRSDSTPSLKGRRVFLGQPGYGEVTAGASRGFWRSTKLPDSQVIYAYREGSLLAANFNALWCDALNLVHGGRRLDYFGMIHSDVEPQDWWLDTLIDEMEAKDLDILGVVVPIKDQKGLTSIALQRPDGDTWRPLCRLTMNEVYRLPETFTSEDVGYPILLNTGLWVCRFHEDWASQVRFTINDEIAYDTNAQRYIPQCEPEDWYFSRLCHEMGLKVGATRKIRVNHRGWANFPNDAVWGQPFDAAWIDQSPLGEEHPEAPAALSTFALPDIDGWLRPEEGEELARLATDKRVLEVGSYCGLSTVCLARTARHVTAIDPHDGRATPAPQGTLEKLRANLDRYGVADRVSIRVGTFGEYAKYRDASNSPTTPFDLIFIDGAHDLESVRADIANALPLLSDSGLIAFHDYRSYPGEFDGRWDPGVSRAVNELLATGGELLSTHATLAVVKPPAPSSRMLAPSIPDETLLPLEA